MKIHIPMLLLLALISTAGKATPAATRAATTTAPSTAGSAAPADATAAEAPAEAAPAPAPAGSALATAPAASAATAPPPKPRAALDRSVIRESEAIRRHQERLASEQTRRLLPWLAVIAAAVIGGAVLQFRTMRRLERRLDVVATTAVVQEEHETLAAAIAALRADVRQNAPSATEIETVRAELGEQLAAVAAQLHDRLARIAERLEENAALLNDPRDLARAEHERLVEQWRRFSARPELVAAWSAAPDEQPWERVFAALETAVPAELRPSFDAAAEPYRPYQQLRRKLKIASRVVAGELADVLPAAAAERARDLTRILEDLQKDGGGALLDFSFEKWMTSDFLPFADLFIRRYQIARAEGSGGAELQRGFALIRELLEAASLAPIDVTPGETRFDSRCHVGSSTSSDPRFPDGVITGVVRNGFIEGGRLVIRQPEVIVNRHGRTT